MKYLVVIALGFLCHKLFSQDTIVKINGEIIEAKIIDTQGSIIRYHYYQALDGPIYILSKKNISTIKYQNGVKQVFISNASMKTSKPEKQAPLTKKSFFIGGHFALGNAAAQDDVFGFFDFNMATNLGADIGYFFNDYIGLKTGLSYLTLPYGEHSEHSISMLGIPANLVLSIGERAGFYTELGAVFYFPKENNISNQIAAENLIGFHITSGRVDIKLGFLLNFTLKGQSKAFDKGSVFMGLNAGLSVFL